MFRYAYSSRVQMVQMVSTRFDSAPKRMQLQIHV
jgi:hypothetical protein